MKTGKSIFPSRNNLCAIKDLRGFSAGALQTFTKGCFAAS
jgi:hypothetical protein